MPDRSPAPDSAPSPIPPPLQSSVDPYRLSMMVKGLLLFVPILAPIIMKYTGVLLTYNDAEEWVGILVAGAASAMTLYGFFRKVLSKRADSVVNVRTKE